MRRDAPYGAIRKAGAAGNPRLPRFQKPKMILESPIDACRKAGRACPTGLIGDGFHPAERVVGIDRRQAAGECAGEPSEVVVRVEERAFGRVGGGQLPLGIVGPGFGAGDSSRGRAVVTNGSNSSTEGVVGIDDRFGRRAVAAVELRQVVKEALFGEAAELVVNRLGDDPFERDVQRLPALVIVLERFGEVTGSDGRIIGGPLDAVIAEAEGQGSRNQSALVVERPTSLVALGIDQQVLVAESVGSKTKPDLFRLPHIQSWCVATHPTELRSSLTAAIAQVESRMVTPSGRKLIEFLQAPSKRGIQFGRRVDSTHGDE